MRHSPRRAATGRQRSLVGVILEGVAVVSFAISVVPIVVILALVFVAALMTILVVGIAFACTYVSSFFPAYSAEFYIKERDTTVTLAFYPVRDFWGSHEPVATEQNSGRFLTVSTPDGQITQKMCGYDWAHNARTSVYLADDHDIALVGVDQCDYVISTRPFSTTPAINKPSDRWIYLGAFDLVDHDSGAGHGMPSHTRELRFIPADEEAECIKAGTGSATIRNAARRASCDMRHRN
jgi:hypothetical protein